MYSCGKKQFRNLKKGLQGVSSKTKHLRPKTGPNPKSCVQFKPAEGHLVFTNTCEKRVQFIWCHQDKSLKHLKKSYCNQDGKNRFFTQGFTVAKGKRYVVTPYRPTTDVFWGACFGTKGAAHAFDGKGGYACK